MAENFKIFIVQGVQILAQKSFIQKPQKGLLGKFELVPVPAIKYVIYQAENLEINESPEMVSVIEACCLPHREEIFESLDQAKMEEVFVLMREVFQKKLEERRKARIYNISEN